MRNGRSGPFRRLVLYLLALALVPLVAAEIATRALTRVLPDNGMEAFLGIPLLPLRPTAAQVRDWSTRVAASSYVAPDPDLGWSIVPSGRTTDGSYEANAQGARARHDVVYAPFPPAGRTRIVAVGDSFTHGDGVSNEETWGARLEALLPELEVVNFGVPGYGTDQAFLRWRRDTRSLRTHFAVLGIWPENLCRNLNVIRYFLQPGGGFSQKPRFLVKSGGLEVIGQPVLEGDALARAITEPFETPLLAHEHWLSRDVVTPRPFQRLRLARIAATLLSVYQRRAQRERLYSGEDPSGIEITVAIAEQWRREVAVTGAVPLVLLIPMRELLDTYPDEDSLPLARALRSAGIELIDLGPPMARAVREHGMACCFQADGHLSREGNDRVAHWLAERLAPRLEEARRRPLRRSAAGTPSSPRWARAGRARRGRRPRGAPG